MIWTIVYLGVVCAIVTQYYYNRGFEQGFKTGATSMREHVNEQLKDKDSKWRFNSHEQSDGKTKKRD